ncbi:MAG: hypothetical protein Q9162_000994 [Coniocarpon cinnabarinum]
MLRSLFVSTSCGQRTSPIPTIFVLLSLIFSLVAAQIDNITSPVSFFHSVGPFNAHDVRPCVYQGTTHLCMFQGNQQRGWARGTAMILNTDYQVVRTIHPGGSAPSLDQHEFKLVGEGETALLTTYDMEAYDLSLVGVTANQGWVLDSKFQEVHTENGSTIFEWSALANMDPFTSYVMPKGSDIAGDGLGPMTPWDFFHMNSIDKSNLTGNYIISARHFGTIFNINGTDGSIIWRLQAGGNSDFDCTDFNFSFQHDAQIRAENETSMTLSLFDNASNGFNQTSGYSSGKLIHVDYVTRKASLAAPSTYYPLNENVLLSVSQGNTQYLDNGNIFHGFGSWPFMSEHTPDGNAVWAANFGPVQNVIMNYRAKSGYWKSIPSNTSPSVWTYSQDNDALLVVYVSWNGCTETGSWNFYGSNDVDGEFTKFGSSPKFGFETMYESETHFTYTIAEAVGVDGVALRNSSVQQTFVPSAQLAASCSEQSCPGI